MLFNIIEEAVIITRSKGVFRQVKAFERNGFIYAQHGSGFIRLTRQGTSLPEVSVDEMDLSFEPTFTQLGYMTRPGFNEGV